MSLMFFNNFRRLQKMAVFMTLVVGLSLIPLSSANAVGYHVIYCTAAGIKTSANVNGPPSKIEEAAASVGFAIKSIDAIGSAVPPGGGGGSGDPQPQDYLDLLLDPTLEYSGALGLIASGLSADGEVIIVSQGDATLAAQVARVNSTTMTLEIADLPLTSLDLSIPTPTFAESAAAFGDAILPAFHDPLDPSIVATADFVLLFTRLDQLGNVLELEQVSIDLSTLNFQPITEPVPAFGPFGIATLLSLLGLLGWRRLRV